MTIRLYFLTLLLVAPACSDDSDPNGSTSSSSTGAPTSTGSSTGEYIGWGGVCYVDLDCGNGGGASCAHPDGCDVPGECAVTQPEGECPNDPAPLIPVPEGLTCDDDAICLDSMTVCFFWDGRCGEGFSGVCRAPDRCAELIPPEITARCPGDGECASPMYDW